MYKRMLVPLDGSELAETVFPYVKELAGRMDIDAVFLHVCSSIEHEFVLMHRAYVDHVAEALERESREIQKKTGLKPGGKEIKMSSEVTAGYPAEEILRFAEKNDIDLIVMATRGYSGMTRWALGSVADKVLRTSGIPVWVVRAKTPAEAAHEKWPVRNIIVPLDGSRLGESVLSHVEALAKLRGTEQPEVVLLRVCEPPAVVPSERSPSIALSWEQYVEHEIARCKKIDEQYLTETAAELKKKDIKVRSEVLVGRAADEIIEYANKSPLSVIVMATHGYSGVTRWAYGSVADKVLHGVSSPILLVRPR